jgi:hypothetical protein
VRPLKEKECMVTMLSSYVNFEEGVPKCAYQARYGYASEDIIDYLMSILIKEDKKVNKKKVSHLEDLINIIVAYSYSNFFYCG